jgi:hypothetical protein
MTRMPASLADQGVLLDPEEADDLVDLLLEAATVIHTLAGDPAAEAAAAQAVTGGRGSCQELAIDLQLAAAAIEDQAASEPAAEPEKELQLTKQASAAGKHPRHASKNQHSGTDF